MQSTQFEIKYIREALCSLIDKILPYIEHKSIYSFCKQLQSKVLDDKMTPYAIYLETQKISESSDNSSKKVLATSDIKFNYSVLQKIRAAQVEFKHDTEQMASIFNSVKENVESVYISSEELKNMMNDKDHIITVNVREDKIRRVSIYKQPQPIIQENKIEFKYEIQTDTKQAIKSEPRIDYKNEAKTESKKLIEISKKEMNFEPKLVQSNQKLQQTQFSSSQKHISIPQQQPQQQQHTQSNTSLQPSPTKPFSYIQTPPHSFNQLSQQKQQQPTPSQFMFTQPNEPKQQQQQTQIGSYVPNYDLLARVDQLLQKSKNSALTQVNTPCLTTRI